MICDKCGEKTNVVTINSKHEKVCDECWGKKEKKSEWERIQEENKKWKNS